MSDSRPQLVKIPAKVHILSRYWNNTDYVLYVPEIYVARG